MLPTLLQRCQMSAAGISPLRLPVHPQQQTLVKYANESVWCLPLLRFSRTNGELITTRQFVRSSRDQKIRFQRTTSISPAAKS